MKITFYPVGTTVEIQENTTILEAERVAGLEPDAPCGGNGSCGKCKVKVNGEQVLACQTKVKDGMCIIVEEKMKEVVLKEGKNICKEIDSVVKMPKYLLAIDIGTTTLACQLLDGKNGDVLATEGLLNPQCSYGGDVVTRIQVSEKGGLEKLKISVQKGLSELITAVCEKKGIEPSAIDVVSIVGNTCMQQLFMGIPTLNLTLPPFVPEIKHTEVAEAIQYLPELCNAKLLVIPDIGGYLGADTIAGVIASGMYRKEKQTLLVDIGTNGEMVLGNKDKMAACATAAGPALEGAEISCGMRGAKGAIDHVWLEKGEISYSVVGGGKPKGICGSGLIDLLAVLKKENCIDRRGNISESVYLAPDIIITQEDIRELQLAKGAIAAGIEVLMKKNNIKIDQIQEVYLAGAFGSYIKKESACEVGLLPIELMDRIQVLGNAAIQGSAMIACRKEFLELSEKLSANIENVELAVYPGFAKIFSKKMYF